MPEYTKEQREQVQQANRVIQREWLRHHPPMSDKEFEKRYDPQGYYDKQVLQLLTEIRDLLKNPPLDTPRERDYSAQVYRPAPTVRPPTGPIKV